MAVAVDASSNAAASGNSNVASQTWSHTVSGADKYIVVGVSIRISLVNTTVSTVTYAGTGLSFLGAINNGTANRSELWGGLTTASGANNVIVTPALTSRITCGATSFTGASGSANYNSAALTDTAPSVTITSAAGNYVQDHHASGSLTAPTVDASQLQGWSVVSAGSGTQSRGAGSSEAGAASVVMSWSYAGSNAWAAGGVSVVTVAAADDFPAGIVRGPRHFIRRKR